MRSDWFMANFGIVGYTFITITEWLDGSITGNTPRNVSPPEKSKVMGGNYLDLCSNFRRSDFSRLNV